MDMIRKILAVFFVAVMVCSLYAIYCHRESIHLSKMTFKNMGGEFNGQAKLNIVSNIGESYCLRMKVSIPCDDRNQFEEIMKRMPRLENDFLLTMDQKELNELIEKRNFEVLRSRILSIVNDNLPWKVNHVYFDTLLYQ